MLIHDPGLSVAALRVSRSETLLSVVAHRDTLTQQDLRSMLEATRVSFDGVEARAVDIAVELRGHDRVARGCFAAGARRRIEYRSPELANFARGHRHVLRVIGDGGRAERILTRERRSVAVELGSLETSGRSGLGLGWKIGAGLAGLTCAGVVALWRRRRKLAALATALVVSTTLVAQEAVRKDLESENVVVVEDRRNSRLGLSESASEGHETAKELALRPLSRRGELLEFVPGFVVTQHSGAGKANQMFLRGFNLDHGTDFATWVDGVRVNMPSHGHGQGYTDLHFLIPELVERLEYRKGPYRASDGDFASAGSVRMDTMRKLEHGFFKVELGSYGFARTLAADSFELFDGNLLWAIESTRDDGRWERPDDFKRTNAQLGYSHGNDDEGWDLRLRGYDGSWFATDQIPRRAVDSSMLSRWGSLDPTSGGATQRLELSGERRWKGARHRSRLSAHLVAYDFELFSNFSYFLDDALRGDQFEQRDRRVFGGLSWQRSQSDRESDWTVGAEARFDSIQNALHRSQARRRFATVRRDEIDQGSLSLWAEGARELAPSVRGRVGLRADAMSFDVAGQGDELDAIVSPSGGLVFGPWLDSEFYVSAGFGFHSNDARGVTAAVDAVPGLVRSRGAEIGLRSHALRRVESTLAIWWLDLDSELVFVGDAGTTEASRGARRYGVEWTVDWQPVDGVTLDVDAGWSHARFRGNDPSGDHVPGAVELAVSAGASARIAEGVSANLRMRHLGKRPLIEDASVESSALTIWNLAVDYRVNERQTLRLEALNLGDERGSDIEYLYSSRLANESQGVEDVHLHSVPPFSLRLSWRIEF